MNATLAPGSVGGQQMTTRFVMGPDGLESLRVFEEAPVFLPGPIFDTNVIDLNPTERHQEMWGFGAALTDACESNLDNMQAKDRGLFMQRVFQAGVGAGFSYLRIPLGGNDYSSGDYTLDDTPDGKPDPELSHFDFSKTEKLIPTLLEAKRLNPDLQLMLTPWTAPAWMKSPVHLKGGGLQPQFYNSYAKYLVRSLQEFSQRGVPIDHLSILNEPYNPYAAQNWDYPQMVMNVGEQKQFIAQYLAPLLEKETKSGKLKTKILLHDHNWDLASHVDELLSDPKISAVSDGVAYHCYGGDLTDMVDSLKDFPETPRFISECSSLLESRVEDTSAFQFWSKNFTIEGARVGIKGALGWNLCLDPMGEPRNPDSDGCPNCRGMMTIHPDGSFDANQEFLALEQVSRFLRKGAIRIGSTDLSVAGLANVAFENPDGSRVLVLRNDTATDVPVSVRDERLWGTRLIVPAYGAVSSLWQSQ